METSMESGIPKMSERGAYKIKNYNYKFTHFVAGKNLTDPFFDSYEDETLTACAILDLAGLTMGNQVTVTFEKSFLRKIISSHLAHIRQMEK